jgi:hypothetical protein
MKKIKKIKINANANKKTSYDPKDPNEFSST